ncbi:MAG: RNA polymerase sigma factor [Microgenomates bacterium 39_7]|nr:MAG: RNA polymerase sigma factor [Microgenomates bacterium 39_7]
MSQTKSTSSSATLPDESKLVRQLKKADPQAVKLWFLHYHQPLLQLAKQKISDPKDAEDVAQETMINCLRQIQLFRQDASLKTWMMTILRHEIADYYRKKYAKKALTTVPLGHYLLTKPIQDSDQVEKQAVWAVQNTLKKMSSYRKKILLMKYVDGLKVKEIAKKLGKTFKSVETDLWRSKEAFKEIYLENELNRR